MCISIFLIIFYKQANNKVDEYAKKLQNSLTLGGLKEKYMPIILNRLQQSALDKKSKMN